MLVDAAQSVPHMPVDVTALGADFLGFTGHKMCGPTGIGVLWGRRELLEEMPPFLGGGEMIETRLDGAVDLRAAAAQVRGRHHADRAGGGPGGGHRLSREIGLDAVHAHEQRLLGARPDRSWRRSTACGSSARRRRRAGAAAISFEVDGVHPHDVSQVLDEHGVAVRAGHHCAWPLHRALGVQASTRASFYLYNTLDEVDALAEGIRQAQRFFQVA